MVDGKDGSLLVKHKLGDVRLVFLSISYGSHTASVFEVLEKLNGLSIPLEL